MRSPGVVWDETLPAEVVTAAMARHMVASTCLLDVDAALGTGFGAHGLHLLDGFEVFFLLGFAAAGLGMVGTVAAEAELVVTVGAGDLCLGRALGLGIAGAVAVFDGEVFAAFGGETGDEVWAGGEVVLRESFVEPGAELVS